VSHAFIGMEGGAVMTEQQRYWPSLIRSQRMSRKFRSSRQSSLVSKWMNTRFGITLLKNPQAGNSRARMRISFLGLAIFGIWFRSF